MSDTNLFPSYFFAGAGGDKNVPQALRQRLALALLAQKRKYPTTLGEGLGAIGDSLGDIGMMRRIEAEAADAEKAGQDARATLAGTPPVPPPTNASPPPVAAAAIASGEASPTSQAPVPPTVQEGSPPRGMTLRPGIATPPPMTAAAPAAPLPPDQQQSYEPGAPVRMSTDAQLADFRGQNPLPPNIPPPPGSAPRGLPPQPPTDKIYPENEFNPIDAASTPPPPARPSVADYGQKLALAPTPPPGAPPAPGDDPRRAIAMAMLRQQMPQAFPGSAPPGQARAMPPPAPPPAAASPPDQGIAAAPPIAPPIAKAPPPPMPAPPPPQQTAQAGPVPGYVLTVPPELPPPPTQTPRMQQIQKMIQDAPASRRESVAAALAPDLADEQAKLAQIQKIYNDKLTQRHELIKMQEEQKASAATRAPAASQAQSAADVEATKARIVSRSGLTPDELYKRLDTEKQSTDQAIKAQSAQQLARRAIKEGVITGYGADMKIAAAKFADFAFKNGLKGDLAANTEIMRAGLNAGLSEAIKTVNGEGGTGVSNTDVRIAQGIQGSDPNLQMKTIQSIMDRAAEINHRKINRYEDYVDKTLGGEPSELRYQSTHGPTAPPDKIKLLADAQADPSKADQYRQFFDQTYGPGAAELELARLERQRRRGK